jgi:DNA-binding transcriptional ArsR family regulator
MMSQPAISKHLSVLEDAGLMWREERRQNVPYVLKEDALTGTLVHLLAEVCPRTRPFRKAVRRPLDARRVSNQDDGAGTAAWSPRRPLSAQERPS